MSSFQNSFSSSENYQQLLCELLSSEFRASSFNELNQNFPLYTHNKHTSSYFPTYNYFFIIEQENKSNEISFFLHGFSLEAQDLIQRKDNIVIKKYAIILEDENQDKFIPPKNFCLEILNNSGYNEDFFVLYGGNLIFGIKNFLKL